MPESLKTYINETEDLKQEQKEGMVWFSCEGENPADKEHIGHIDYLPKPGVPKFHYPYTNQDGYHSPAVFAHFTNPKRKLRELNPIPTRLGHVTLIYGLIPPMAGRNRVNRLNPKRIISTF